MKSLKKIFLIALLAFASSNVFSQDYTASLSINNDNIVNAVPGGSGTFDLILTNTDPEITVIGFELTLPEGATLGKPSTYTKYDNVQSVSRNLTDEGYYVVTIESIFDEDENEEIPLNVNSEGAKIVTFTIDYAADFAGGEGKLANIVIGGAQSYKDKSLVVPVTFKAGAAETVEIALGNASGYNTYVSDKDLDFTGLDAKAYIVSAVSATEATLSPVDAIKAGEGFIIQGAGEATIEVPVAAETPAASGTLLATGQPSEGDYLLAKDGSSFVLWDGTGTLAATKAYLPASAISSGAKIINIAFGESTGISEVKKSEADGAIYNLSGMRVSKTQKGVYIMNGRKVIVK